MPCRTPEEQREYQRRWMAARRAKALEGLSCAYCESTEDLHFHHVDPFDKISHNVWSWTEERRAEELKKCVVLCRSCHQEHHARERRQHGTVNRYSKGGCRCDLCKEAKSRKNAEERARRKLREAAA